jgi:L-asparagine transporter-like permease
MYLGPPNLIATNTGKNFVSKEFVNNATSLAIKVKEVLVKAYNSIYIRITILDLLSSNLRK